MNEIIKTAFITAEQLLTNFYQDAANLQIIANVANGITKAFTTGNKILICGNGGSLCDAMHFAEEFTGRYRKNRSALPVMHLGDPGHLTCVANDYGFNEVFARGVEAFGKNGDWLIGLSTSGNSENILNALQVAKKNQLHTFTLLGKDGGKMRNLAEYELIIPGQTADRIQEVHMLILHILIEIIERNLFPENY